MAPVSQELGPPTNPGRFTRLPDDVNNDVVSDANLPSRGARQKAVPIGRLPCTQNQIERAVVSQKIIRWFRKGKYQ
jgi:hypothetical protein